MAQVILVDENDRQIGTAEKLEAHWLGGLLHRAISVVIFSLMGEMLLQRRADGKYHCPGLWANAACSHPAPGETSIAAAYRRLKEEMGIEGVELQEVFTLTYCLRVGVLVEHELDHVFVGVSDKDATPITPNPAEVQAYRWVETEELRREVEKNPDAFAPWFLLIYKKLQERKGQ